MKGDVINFVRNIDNNWIEGELKGRTGLVPRNYIKKIANNWLIYLTLFDSNVLILVNNKSTFEPTLWNL